MLGRRQSHIANEAHEPANIPYVLLGTGMLWFGWFGFNAGSALSAGSLASGALVATHFAAAAATLGWMLIEWMKSGKPTVLGAIFGAVAGLVVAISGRVCPSVSMADTTCTWFSCRPRVSMV